MDEGRLSSHRKRGRRAVPIVAVSLPTSGGGFRNRTPAWATRRVSRGIRRTGGIMEGRWS